ncbi:hypothetical protein [Streptomyces sp. NBC_01304]|uniref:hypothetical protein n=1 Tax=Streptomyces sp. NBC_01304 TaxID=2903818 RepID=UPI002E0D9DB1|nr:hypothetical protein OG430_28390 [Streptomyces sp. NBC_01304]
MKSEVFSAVLNAAEKDLETFFWYGEDPDETVRPETRVFAVDFMNGLIDKGQPKPPQDTS